MVKNQGHSYLNPFQQRLNQFWHSVTVKQFTILLRDIVRDFLNIFFLLFLTQFRLSEWMARSLSQLIWVLNYFTLLKALMSC